MANEAVKVEGPYEVHDFTCGNNFHISSGTLCALAEPRTLSGSNILSGCAFAGIAATEKKVGDGATNLGLYTKGIFKLTACPGLTAAIEAGNMVVLSGANIIRPAAAGDLLTGAVIGKAMEDIAQNTTGEVAVGFI